MFLKWKKKTENFNIYIFVIFDRYCQKSISGKKSGHYAFSMANFDVLLIFLNFNLNVLGNFLGKLRTRFLILDSYKESCCPKPQVAEPLKT